MVVLLVLLGLLALALHQATRPSHVAGCSRAGGEVLLAVLVDNHRYRPGLETAWGLSILLESGETVVLFDTGPSPSILLHNARVMGFNLSRVGVVVISHRHLDHCGGLQAVPRRVRLYIPPDQWLREYAERLGFKPVIVNSTTEVAPGVYVLKPLLGPPWEVALAVRTGRGVVVVTGCAHPGVVGFVREALRLGHVYMVIGGFHLAGAPPSTIRRVVEELIGMGVEKIAPIHCSGEEIVRYLEERHPGVLVRAGAGYTVELPASG